MPQAHSMLLLKVSLKRCKNKLATITYPIIISFGETAAAILTFELLPIAQMGLLMLDQMLPHISLLGEALAAELADIGSYAIVHPDVVKQVPSPHESFASLIVLTLVHHDHLPILVIWLQKARVGVPLQLLQIVNVGLRSLVLDNISIKSSAKSVKENLEISNFQMFYK